MDTNAHESEPLLHKELVYSVVGCAMEMLNGLGHGLHEKPYENALVVEFGLKGLGLEQQRRFPILYKTVQVGEYVPDLLVASALVVDAKVHRRRMRSDAELSSHHQAPRGRHPEFQTPEARMGARRPLTHSCSFVSIRG